MSGQQSFNDQWFLWYEYGVFLAFFRRFYQKRVLMSNFTRQIRNQDHQVDQKKFIPLITSDRDTYLTLPLV